MHPQVETYTGNVDPIGTRAVYDEAKRFAESLTMAYHRSHNVNTSIVRIFNTYGPRLDLEDGRALPNMIKQALLGQPLTVYGDGSQTRSFCYVDDLIDGIVKLLYSEEHFPVNMGNPHERTILQFAETINKVTGNTAGITYVDARSARDPQRRRPDITRAQTILNWEHKVIRSVQDDINDNYLSEFSFNGDNLESRIRIAPDLSLTPILERFELGASRARSR